MPARSCLEKVIFLVAVGTRGSGLPTEFLSPILRTMVSVRVGVYTEIGFDSGIIATTGLDP
jgi:hypothetical protein